MATKQIKKNNPCLYHFYNLYSLCLYNRCFLLNSFTFPVPFVSDSSICIIIACFIHASPKEPSHSPFLFPELLWIESSGYVLGLSKSFLMMGQASSLFWTLCFLGILWQPSTCIHCCLSGAWNFKRKYLSIRINLSSISKCNIKVIEKFSESNSSRANLIVSSHKIPIFRG